jgi:DNA polymerase III subunit epsilon
MDEALLSRLKLKRPLVVLDLETTGTDVGTDRIVELAMIKVELDGTLVKKPSEAGPEHRFLINPGRPIPLESSLVHGIYDGDVAEKPTFKQYAKGISKFLEGCDLSGFNSSRFDIPLLAEEFLRAGVEFSLEGRHLIDAQNIFHKMEPRTLKAAYRFYCDKELEGAHAAMPDTEATLEVLLSQLHRYENTTFEDSHGEIVGPLPQGMPELDEFCQYRPRVDAAGKFSRNEAGEITFAFGKHKDEVVSKVLARERGYLDWFLKADFPEYSKRVLRMIADGTFENQV